MHTQTCTFKPTLAARPPANPSEQLKARQARRACERLFDDAHEREAMRVEVAGALQEVSQRVEQK